MRQMDLDRALFRGTEQRVEEVLTVLWAQHPNLKTVLTYLHQLHPLRREQVLEILFRTIPDAKAQADQITAALKPSKPTPPKPTGQPSPRPPVPTDQATLNTQRLNAMLRPLKA